MGCSVWNMGGGRKRRVELLNAGELWHRSELSLVVFAAAHPLPMPRRLCCRRVRWPGLSALAEEACERAYGHIREISKRMSSQIRRGALAALVVRIGSANRRENRRLSRTSERAGGRASGEALLRMRYSCDSRSISLASLFGLLSLVRRPFSLSVFLPRTVWKEGAVFTRVR